MDLPTESSSKPNDSTLSQAKEIVSNVQSTALAGIEAQAASGEQPAKSDNLNLTFDMPKPSAAAETIEFVKSTDSSPYSDEPEQQPSTEESPEDFKDITGLLKQVNAQKSLESLEDLSYDKIKNLDNPLVSGNAPTKMPELSAYFNDPMTQSIVDFDKKLSPEVEEPPKEVATGSLLSNLDDTALFNTSSAVESSFFNEQPPEWSPLDDSQLSQNNDLERSILEDDFQPEVLECSLPDSVIPVVTSSSSDLMKAFTDEPWIEKASNVTSEKEMSFDTQKDDDLSGLTMNTSATSHTSASTLNFSTEENKPDNDLSPPAMTFGTAAPEPVDEFLSFTDNAPAASEPTGTFVDQFSASPVPPTDYHKSYAHEAAGEKISTMPEFESESVAEEVADPFKFESHRDVAMAPKKVDQSALKQEVKEEHEEKPVYESVTDSKVSLTSSAPAPVEDDVAGLSSFSSPVTIDDSFSPFAPSTLTKREADAVPGYSSQTVSSSSPFSSLFQQENEKITTTTTSSLLQEDNESADKFEPAAQAEQKTAAVEEKSSSKFVSEVQSQQQPVSGSTEPESVSLRTGLADTNKKADEDKQQKATSSFEPSSSSFSSFPSSLLAQSSSSTQQPVTKHLTGTDATSSESPNTTNINTPTVSKQETESSSSKNTSAIMGRKNNRRDNSQESFDSTPDAVYEYIQTTLGPNAAELVYWRDAKASGVVFGAGLAILFSLTCFSVISVVSNTLMLAVLGGLGARVYIYVQQILKKTEASHPFKEYLDFEFNPSKDRTHEIVDQLLSQVTCFVNTMRSVLLFEDFILSIKYLIVIWLFTYIGAWFNGMTLIILSFIAVFSLPKVYENNKSQIDSYLDLINGKINEVTNKVPFLKKAEAEKED